MGMKKNLSTLILAAHLMGGGFAQGGIEVEAKTEAEKKKKEEDRLIAQGHKWFDIEGTPILALNKTHAMRKFHKQNPL